jgi:hypothetical protein
VLSERPQTVELRRTVVLSLSPGAFTAASLSDNLKNKEFLLCPSLSWSLVMIDPCLYNMAAGYHSTNQVKESHQPSFLRIFLMTASSQDK